LTIGPVEYSIISDSQTTKAKKFLRHIRKLMMNDLRSIFAKPDQATEDSSSRLGIELLEIGLGRREND
jgi:hypothetical protein